MITEVHRLLGIDPSLCKTGWGIIDTIDNDFTHISHGTILTKSKWSTEARLAFISSSILKIIEEYSPTIVIIEDTFCGINPVTNLRLGFASGAIMSIAGTCNLCVHRYPTRLVKRVIANHGSADKEQIAIKVKKMLNLIEINSLDASDALAVALTHAIQNGATHGQ